MEKMLLQDNKDEKIQILKRNKFYINCILFVLLALFAFYIGYQYGKDTAKKEEKYSQEYIKLKNK